MIYQMIIGVRDLGLIKRMMDEEMDVVKLNDQSSSSLDYFSNKLLFKKADISIL